MSWTSIGVAAWVVLAVGWYVIRFSFARRAKRARVAASARGTAETVRMAVSLTGLGILPGIFAATRWPRSLSYEPSALQIVLGCIAAAFALVLFRLTHKALGKMWSVSLDIREDHKLVTSGIYSRLRHPMYLAFWAMAVAQALLLPNWLAGLSGLVGFGTLFFLRIGPEERMMEEAFGDEFRAYRARTARIIPGIY
ncbi:protein-S-isoprenylcysteine O-methyltransferase [Antarcticirhabdus aurantiaca]|uniref:Protein-S-isoprenylcysteine O-methyltransferase n=1 Tax=Antarcticirhabdus aurantiaca TaxID=2606717 RepID=A0ACD4NHA8_9HYPH|nr:protein-S-isoprenylcysteine O-methyltransferase [Antarcticirhabdus aurantiaca]WAJ26182.1 protein-S-isoprenylcysteine O-methyltransferase [Jeongeuplla avenae]